MNLVTKSSGRRPIDTAVGSQQVFIGFANFYRRFIQGFSRIATSLTAILKTTGSSVTSASRVDDDGVIGSGGGAGAESNGSVVEWKVGSIVWSTRRTRKVSTHPVYLRELAWLPRRLLQRYPPSMPTSHSLRTWLPNFPSTLGSTTMLLKWLMPTDLSDHLSHLQMLPFFSTGSRTDPFRCVLIIEAPIMFPAMSVLMARAVSRAMTGLTFQDKLGKVWFFQETFLLADTSLVLGMPFLTLNSVFAEGDLVWTTYTATKALPTTKRVALFSAKEFATAALEAYVEAWWCMRHLPVTRPWR